MPTRDQLFPSKYLKGHDLRGREATVTIDHVETTRIRGDKVNIIHFAGKDKGLVMNVTIYNQIADVLGEENTDAWGGQQITIFPTEVEFNGEMKSVVRVRTSRPRQSPEADWQAPAAPPARPSAQDDYQPPPSRPDPDDDVPF